MPILAVILSSSASRDLAAAAPVVAYRAAQRSVFLYGFAKNERDNIDDRELADLKKLARHYLSYSDAQIATALMHSELTEIACDDEEDDQEEE